MSWTGKFRKQANKNSIEEENYYVAVALRTTERIQSCAQCA